MSVYDGVVPELHLIVCQSLWKTRWEEIIQVATALLSSRAAGNSVPSLLSEASVVNPIP